MGKTFIISAVIMAAGILLVEFIRAKSPEAAKIL